jgi:hypothetical protein
LGAVCTRNMLGGEWWTLNLVVRGVGDVLLILLEHLGWGFRRNFHVTPNLKREMAPRLDFDMISECGDVALKAAFSDLFGISRRCIQIE